MLRRLFSSLLWSLLVLMAYFSSDIIDKGLVLNSLTPYPVLGWLMWLLMALLLWRLLLSPICQFLRMRQVKDFSQKAQVRQALRELKPYKDADPQEPKRLLYWELNNEWERPARIGENDAAARECRLAELLERCRKASDRGERARKAILHYSQAAGVGVVFCRNNLMDGLIMLVLQMKLVLELARIYGYKPSPVFNILCFGWLLGNSLVAALLAQSSAEAVGSYAADFSHCISEMLLNEDEGAYLTADIVGTKLVQGTISALVEAIMSGTAVYVTGRIFLRRLERDGEALSLEGIIKYRREGRLLLGKELITSMPKELAVRAYKGGIGLVGNLFGGGAMPMESDASMGR